MFNYIWLALTKILLSYTFLVASFLNTKKCLIVTIKIIDYFKHKNRSDKNHHIALLIKKNFF